MNSFGKLTVFSLLVLFASIFIYKSIDFSQYHYQIRIITRKTFEIALKIDSFLKYFGIKGLHRVVENGFSNMQFYMVNSSGLNIERREFDGVEVFLFGPIKYQPNRPALIYYHGGGFVYYNPKFFSSYLAELARRLNILIVSVNYRKAPEHPFPAGVSDSLTATKYFLKNAEKFQVDPNRVALMGDSAGGMLVVVVAYHIATSAKVDKSMRIPKILISIIPAFQLADFDTPSYRDDSHDKWLKRWDCFRLTCLYAFGDLSQKDHDDCINVVSTNSHLNEETVEKVRDNIDWKKYLSGSDYDKVAKSTFKPTSNKFVEKLSKLVMDPLFSPLSALNNTELGLLPPVYLVVASMDPLRDDSRMLAARLAKIKHVIELKEVDQYHAEFLVAGLKSEKFEEVFNYVFETLKRNKIL